MSQRFIAGILSLCPAIVLEPLPGICLPHSVDRLVVLVDEGHVDGCAAPVAVVERQLHTCRVCARVANDRMIRAMIVTPFMGCVPAEPGSNTQQPYDSTHAAQCYITCTALSCVAATQDRPKHTNTHLSSRGRCHMRVRCQGQPPQSTSSAPQHCTCGSQRREHTTHEYTLCHSPNVRRSSSGSWCMLWRTVSTQTCSHMME